MVCLGNIYRSPIAQGVMEKCIREFQLDWEVDSAGTNGYHNGESPDPRAIAVDKKYQIDISKQTSRQVRPKDLDEFDLILAIYSNNYQYLQSLSHDPNHRSKIKLLMNFAYPDSNKAVPDLYYDNSFLNSYELIQLACNNLVLNFIKV